MVAESSRLLCQKSPLARFFWSMADRGREDVATLRAILRFQAGQTAAFQEIYDRHFAYVYRFTLAMLHDPHEAEDASQETFARAFVSLGTYQITAVPFRAWLLVVARRHALRLLDRRKRSAVLDPTTVDAHVDTTGSHRDSPADFLVRRSLSRSMAGLTTLQRQVVLLRHIRDFSVRETACVLDSTPNAVRLVERRALAHMRERWIAASSGSPLCHAAGLE